MSSIIKSIAAGLLFSTSLFATSTFADEMKPQSALAENLAQNIQSAQTAFDEANYREAALYLRTAAENAQRLELQAVSQRVATNASLFQSEDARFTLADSSTLSFNNYLKDRKTLERRFRDNSGRVVTVRVFAEDSDLNDFMIATKDTKVTSSDTLQVVEMAGAPAIKKTDSEKGLSVLMMAEDDHALVEITGESEESVMAFIEQIEKAKN